jgi:hypothetical protein
MFIAHHVIDTHFEPRLLIKMSSCDAASRVSEALSSTAL